MPDTSLGVRGGAHGGRDSGAGSKLNGENAPVTFAYSDRDLEAMLRLPESDLVERKESLRGDASTAIRQAICAYANDLPGHGRAGVVFVGVNDAGSTVGLDITDALLRRLADMKSDGNILPPPTLAVERRVLGGMPLAVITVTPSDAPPVRLKGRIWVRTGPRRDIATAQDERVLNERRRHRDAPFDAQPVPSASVADLDTLRFSSEYLPRAVDAETLAQNDRTLEQRLAALKMIASVDDPTPTVAGVLVLSPRPQDFIPAAWAQFLRIEGVDLSDPVSDAERCTGPIADVVRRLEEKLVAHNRTAVDFTSSEREVRTSLYPMDALRELVRNAVMHRSYEGTNAPIHVYWFDDRIEITNPGGPSGAITPEAFGTPGLVDYRNPVLADAMRVLGLAQRFGAGIPSARRALQRNGSPDLEYQTPLNWVICTVKARLR